MAELIQILDYDEDTLDKILEQFKNSDNLKSIIKAANISANELEDALFEIRDLFWLGTAEGNQLDVIGIIWGVPRSGLNDTDYLQIIISRIAIINSGEPESIISLIKLLFAATFVTYLPDYPAGFYIYTDGTITFDQLTVLSPAGVRAALLQAIHDANGNYLADANGNVITCVAPYLTEYDFIFEDGDLLSFIDGDTLSVV